MRVKRGNVARNRRKKILKLAKGFRASTSKLFRPARQAVINALRHSYKGRRQKKRDFRCLWIARLTAALVPSQISYSKFIGQATKKQMLVNRKMLSELAISNPEIFSEIVTHVTA
jgi:large subunit ribosomal protein L20